MSNATHLTSVGSGPGNWRTPPDLHEKLNRVFQFDYDAFADHENALCKTYSTVDGTFRERRSEQPWPELVLSPEPPRIWHEQIDSLDGLRQDWDRRRVWMNPPYNEEENPCNPTNCKKKRCERRGYCIDEYVPGLNDFMEKAASERDSATLIVALIPANTDTGWWHEYVKPYAQVHYLRGRVQFIDPETGNPGGSPPGGSAVAVYYPEFLR